MSREVLTEAQRAFFREPLPAVATTLRRDGSPHSTVVWIDERDGDVLFNTTLERAKGRHLKRDPRVSVLLVDPADQYRWVAVSGTATLVAEGAAEHMETLWQRYTGRPGPTGRPGTWVTVRVRPERVSAYKV